MPCLLFLEIITLYIHALISLIIKILAPALINAVPEAIGLCHLFENPSAKKIVDSSILSEIFL